MILWRGLLRVMCASAECQPTGKTKASLSDILANPEERIEVRKDVKLRQCIELNAQSNKTLKLSIHARLHTKRVFGPTN
jgi:hypothetical protein